MLTVEVKINGSLIIYIYARNRGLMDSKGDIYEYEIYEVGKEIKRGEVSHGRSKGALSLIKTIIEKGE